MSSRRPPSKRNAEYVDQRQSRMLQSMVPGTVGGRVASASPVSAGPDGVVESASDTQTLLGAGDLLFARDTFTLASPTPTLELSFVPVENSWHVVLFDDPQWEGDDYTIDGKTLTILSAMDADIGDPLEVRYSYYGAFEDVPEDDTALLLDTFDRADGP